MTSTIYEEKYFGAKQPQLNDLSSYDREPWYKETVNCLGSFKDKIILDVGCGAGKAMNLLKGASIFGVDVSKFGTRIACQFGEVIVANAGNLPFKENVFDSVLMVEVAEHLNDEELGNAFREVRRVLKKSGIVIIHTQPNGLFGRFFYFFNRKRLEDTGHVNTLSPFEVRHLLLKYNFIVKRFEVKDFIILKHLERRNTPTIVKWVLGNRILAVAKK